MRKAGETETYKGQHYTCMDVRLTEFNETWESECITCGTRFTFILSSVAYRDGRFRPNRRCKQCRKP
jgi:hypothetical protein